MLYWLYSDGDCMIRVEQPNDNWYYVSLQHIAENAIKTKFTRNLQHEIISWCDEQNNDSHYYIKPQTYVIDPITFAPVATGDGEMWFEDQTMATWFNLRWGHIC